MNSRIIKWPALGYFCLLLAALCLGSTNDQKHPPSPTLEQPAETVRIERLIGEPWLVYEQGPTTHVVRLASVSAVLERNAGRHTIYFAGGQLHNECDLDEVRKVLKQLEGDNEGASDEK